MGCKCLSSCSSPVLTHTLSRSSLGTVYGSLQAEKGEGGEWLLPHIPQSIIQWLLTGPPPVGQACRAGWCQTPSATGLSV